MSSKKHRRGHIDAKVLAAAAKWSRPKLRKRYTHGPKSVTVSKFLKSSNDSKLKQKYGDFLAKNNAHKKKVSFDGSNTNNNDNDEARKAKVHEKYDSLNNFANLKTSNAAFAAEKNRQRKENKLQTLENLAWETVTIPENDRVFGSSHATHATHGDDDDDDFVSGARPDSGAGSGAVQVIDSKTFFGQIDIGDLHVEEYVLDDAARMATTTTTTESAGTATVTARDRHHNVDRHGLKQQLDINVFNKESQELWRLLQCSLHRIDPSKVTLGSDAASSASATSLKHKKTMKQKEKEKKLKMLQKQFADEVLFQNASQIEESLLDILGINASEKEYAHKQSVKQKWIHNAQQRRLQQQQQQDSHAQHLALPPTKKRKLSDGEKSQKNEFRHQIENLHEKQNIAHITARWNALLRKGPTQGGGETGDDHEQGRVPSSSSNAAAAGELLSHINLNSGHRQQQQCVTPVTSKSQCAQCIEQCTKAWIVVYFYDASVPQQQEEEEQQPPVSSMERFASAYMDNVQCLTVDMQNAATTNVCQQYNVDKASTFLLLRSNGKIIGRCEGDTLALTQSALWQKLGLTPRPDGNGVNDNGCNALHPLLLRGLADLGFREPTRTQREVIPIAMNGTNDVLIAAATGSGKTLAFAIPIVHDLLRHALGCRLYALVLTPTRELAIQIESHVQSLLKYATLQCMCVVGGMSAPKQRRLLSTSPEIVIATPGRLWQLMHDSESLHLRDLTALRYLVLDEADRLLSSAHYEELNHILGVVKMVWNVNDMKRYFEEEKAENVSAFLDDDNDDDDDEDEEDAIKQDEALDIALVPRRQTFVVSATLTLESVNRSAKNESKIPVFANLATVVPFQESIKVVDQTPQHRTTSNVQQYEIAVDAADKDAMLAYLLCEYEGRCLIFANTIGSVKRVTLIVKEMGFNVHAIHSQQQQRQRLKNLDRFVKTRKSALVCTDVCARGLDIPSVDHIIHFQVPLCAEDYIHRTGRVGRHEAAEASEEQRVDGRSYLMVSARELKLYNQIVLALKRPEGLTKLAINERLLIELRRQAAISKRIAAVLDDTRRTKRKTSSLQRMADAAGIELDEINCRALNIKKSMDNARNGKADGKKKRSKKNQHSTFEYNVDEQNILEQQGNVGEQIKELRQELKRIKSQHDWKRPKSSYLTRRSVVDDN